MKRNGGTVIMMVWDQNHLAVRKTEVLADVLIETRAVGNAIL